MVRREPCQAQPALRNPAACALSVAAVGRPVPAGSCRRAAPHRGPSHAIRVTRSESRDPSHAIRVTRSESRDPSHASFPAAICDPGIGAARPRPSRTAAASRPGPCPPQEGTQRGGASSRRRGTAGRVRDLVVGVFDVGEQQARQACRTGPCKDKTTRSSSVQQETVTRARQQARQACGVTLRPAHLTAALRHGRVPASAVTRQRQQARHARRVREAGELRRRRLLRAGAAEKAEPWRAADSGAARQARTPQAAAMGRHCPLWPRRLRRLSNRLTARGAAQPEAGTALFRVSAPAARGCRGRRGGPATGCMSAWPSMSRVASRSATT